MKNIIKRFQETMMAATFAEAGDWDTAREMIPVSEASTEPSWLDRVFMAATFAEAGLHDEAVRLMDPAAAKRQRGYNSAVLDSLGLKGVRLMYGTVTI